MKAAEGNKTKVAKRRRALPALLATALVALALLLVSPASAAVPNICALGAAAGKCNHPQGVAVDQSTGTVYIADPENNRIDEFDSAGHFLRAFGVGVRDGVKELETCTTLCTRGRGTNGEVGPLPGAMTPYTVAVDSASHDVYVTDPNNARVEKYDEAGELLLMFGKEIDEGPHHPGDVCTATNIAEGDSCGQGVRGPGPGEMGQLSKPPLAFDSSGHLWVGGMERVEEFSAGGAFLSEVALPGAGEVASLAIDTDPLSTSYEDFYTLEPFVPGKDEKQQIIPPGGGESGGEYTLSFGGFTTKPLPFDAENEASKCSEFTQPFPAQICPIAAAIQELPSVGIGNVMPAGGHEMIFVGALADTDVEQMTASAGVTVKTNLQGEPETPGVLTKRKPNGEALEIVDAAGEPTAVAVDPASGAVFVSDQFEPGNQRPATLLSYSSAGAQTAAFGSGEVIGGPVGNALAFGSTAQRLYVASSRPKSESAFQPFPLPAPGPLPVGGSAKAKPIQKLGATLCSRVNPEHAETKAHFQYIPAATYEADGNSFGAGTLETSESGSLGSDFSFNHELCQPISSLQPAAGYRFRLVAKNPNGTVKGETASFETLPPAAIDSTGVSGVSADAATLEAEVNPLGDATTYGFEYLTEGQAKENEEASEPPFAGAAQAPLQAAAIGAGSSDVAVSQHLQGLSAGAAYRYRVVVRNAISEAHGGPFPGASRTFTTQIPSAATLPDQRAWELVSPPDKHGAKLRSGKPELLIQAADNGDALAYVATAPTEAEVGGYSAVTGTTVLAGRGAGGWASRDLTPPHAGEVGAALNNGNESRAFNSDLSLSISQPFGPFEPQISPAASEQTAFLRTDFVAGQPSSICANGEGCYRPLVTGCPAAGECPAAMQALADVPPGTEFGVRSGCGACKGPWFVSGTPDLSHVVLESGGVSPIVLTPGAPPQHGLYEWSAGAPPGEALRLVGVLPDGTPVEAFLGFEETVLRNAISSDGSRVFFEAEVAGKKHLYLRYNATEEQSAINGGGECTEATKACTIQLDAIQGGVGASQTANARFQDATADGSRIFFTDTQQLTEDAGGASHGGGDLYECRIVEGGSGAPECDLADLTPETGGEAAGVPGPIAGISADGSSVYFVADGVLSGEEENARGESALPGNCEVKPEFPSPGEICNLYLRRGGKTSLIAVLAGVDRADWGRGEYKLKQLPTRVSPSGRWLAFASQRPLTGYDNRDAVSGERDEEVFLYRAGEEGTLLCASCNPSGARPHGVEFKNLEQTQYGSWEQQSWLAANVPGWYGYNQFRALYQPRYLSDSGRLFFNSSDALVPQDVNGQEDVYEYEPPQSAEEAPPNDSCTTSSPTYSPISGGCVSLISSGTSSEESAFLDASESGSDVFFLTTAKLVPQDVDSSYDAYDARAPHVPGEQVGFPEALKPVECTGDACQAPASPPNDPTPGSLTFQGSGNVKEEAPTQTRCAKGKVRRSGRCVAKKKHKAKAKRKRAAKSKGRAGR